MDAVIIESEALKLPDAERAMLIDHLQSSLSGTKIAQEEDHLKESRDRFDAYQAGNIKALGGEAVVSGIRERLSS